MSTYSKPLLVGGFNPSEKYAGQIGWFPQIGQKIENIWNHHLVYICCAGVWELKFFWRKNTFPDP